MTKIKKETITNLKSKGWKYSQICKKYNISIYQLHQILNQKENEDFDIIKKIKEGDENAFSQLYERYYQLVENIVNYKLQNSDLLSKKNDIIQDAFFKAFKKIHKYHFQDKKKFGSWLSTIAYNTIIDTIRKRQKEGTKYSLEPSNPFQDETNDHSEGKEQGLDIKSNLPNPEDVYFNHQIKEQIKNFVNNELSDFLKHIFVLRYEKEYQYSEIAQELNMNLNTIKTYVKQIRELAKEKLNYNFIHEYIET